MSDESVLDTARSLITAGLLGAAFAAGVSITNYWMVSIGFGAAGLGLIVVGITMLVWSYQREEKIVVWNGLLDGMNARCEGCGGPAYIFNPAHEGMARCVVCGGTIKLLTSGEEKELEVDDVFGNSRETVDCDAPAGGGD